MNFLIKLIGVVGAAALVLAPGAAFAGKPRQIEAPAAIVSSGAPGADAHAAHWVDGKRQELNGIESLKAAEKALRKAEKSNSKDEAAVVKTEAVASNTRGAYRSLVAGFGGATDPGSIDAEIKALKKAQDNWADALKDYDKARASLSQSQVEIDAAQSAIRTANEAVTTGRGKMQEAEFRVTPAARVGASSDRSDIY